MNKRQNNKKGGEQSPVLLKRDEEEPKITVKEEAIQREVRLKKVKQNKKLTGKSKEYINSLSQKGCPSGRKRCAVGCTLVNSKKSLNIKKSQNKLIDTLKNEPIHTDDLDECTERNEITEIGNEDVIKNFEVVLLSE